MKIRKTLLLLLISAICLCALCSCNSGSDGLSMQPEAKYSAGDTAQGEGTTGETAPDRKIIYSASINLGTDDFDASVAKIRSSLAADEWFDSESVSDGYAVFTVRVKTTRLDEYLLDISYGATTQAVEKKAEDISLKYQSAEDAIAALNEEKTLLNSYVETAGAAEKLSAITRIAQINTEIKRLNGELNTFDSLVEYSTVTVTLRKNYTEEEIAYAERANNSFYGAWKALGTFFSWLGIAFVACFPFILVFGTIGGGITLLVLFIKRKKPFDKIPRKEKRGGRSADGNVDGSTSELDKEKQTNDACEETQENDKE